MLRSYRRMLDSSVPAIVQSLAKVIISCSQCLGGINRFNLVRMPDLFFAFVEKLDFLNIELFSVVPAECVTGRRLGFYFEMLATLSIPFIVFLGVLIMIVVVRNFTRRYIISKEERRLDRWWWTTSRRRW